MAGQGGLFSIGDDELDLGDEDFLLAESAGMGPTTAGVTTSTNSSLQQNNNLVTKTTFNKNSTVDTFHPSNTMLTPTRPPTTSFNSSFLASFDDDFGDDNVGSFLTKRRGSDSPVLGVQPPLKQHKTSNSPPKNSTVGTSSGLQGKEQKIGGASFSDAKVPTVQGRSLAILNKIQGLSSSSNETQNGSGLRVPVADTSTMQSPTGRGSKPGKFVFKPVNKSLPNSPSVPGTTGFTLRPNNVFNANGGGSNAVPSNSAGGSPLLTSGFPNKNVEKSPSGSHLAESPGTTGRLSRVLGGTSSTSNGTETRSGQDSNNVAVLNKGNATVPKMGDTSTASAQLRAPVVNSGVGSSSSTQLRNSASFQNKPTSKGFVFGSKANNSQQVRAPEANNASLTSTTVQNNSGIQTNNGLRNPTNAPFKSTAIRNPLHSTSGVQGNMATQGNVGASHAMSASQARFTQPRPMLPQGRGFAPRAGNITSAPRFPGQSGTPRVPQSSGMVAPRMQQTPRMHLTPTMHQNPRMPQGRGGPIRQRSPNGPSSGLYSSSFRQNSLPDHQAQTGSPGSFLSPQAPVCTSRLLKLCNTSRPKDLTPRAKKRKFPGPAGILPKLSEDKQLDDVAIATPQTPSHSAVAKKPKDEDLSSSQLSQEDPRRGSWDTLKKELGLHEDNSNCILGKNNIALVLRRASLKLLPQGKVPQLCVWVKFLSLDGANGSAVFRDHTGEMQGTIHHKVLEEYPTEVKPGTSLVLRQVGVFSPSARNHYLNITVNNIVQVYPPGATSGITSNPSSQDSPEMHPSPPDSGQAPWLKFQDMSPISTRVGVSQLSSAGTSTVGMSNTQKPSRQPVQQLAFSSALEQSKTQRSSVAVSEGKGTAGKPTSTGANNGVDGSKQEQNVEELWGEDNLDALLEDIGEEMFGDF